MADSKIEAGVYLDIHEAAAYAGRPIQVSINKRAANGSEHGYRIAGPKFALSGARLLRRVKLDARTAAEIRRYLDMVAPAASQAAADRRPRTGREILTLIRDHISDAESRVANAKHDPATDSDEYRNGWTARTMALRELAEDIADGFGHYLTPEPRGRS
jgi:hypothetical protein